MGWFEWLAQLAVVALLAGTIPVALRLERALRAVRRDREELGGCAATLDAAIRADIPDLDAQVAAGNFAPLLAWLRPRVHRRGKLAAPEAIIAEAAGRKPEPAILLAALERKYGEIYDL